MIQLPNSDTLNRGVLFGTAFCLVILAIFNVFGFFNDSFTCGAIDTDEEKRAKFTDSVNRQLNLSYGIFGVVLAVYAINYAKHGKMDGTWIYMLAGVAVLILASWFSVFGQNMDFQGKVFGGNKQTKCRHPIEGIPITMAVVSILMLIPAAAAMFQRKVGN